MPVGRLAARSLRLIAFGLLISNLYWLADPAHNPWRAFGVLQRIGLTYFVAALIYLRTGPRLRLCLAALLLLAFWPITLLPVPGGGATDLRAVGANFVSWTERSFLGIHAYRPGPHGYDPEGLLGVLPSVAQALIRPPPATGCGRAAGPAPPPWASPPPAWPCWRPASPWSLVYPPVKALWTSSMSSFPAYPCPCWPWRPLLCGRGHQGLAPAGPSLRARLRRQRHLRLHRPRTGLDRGAPGPGRADTLQLVGPGAAPSAAASLVPVAAFVLLLWDPAGLPLPAPLIITI